MSVTTETCSNCDAKLWAIHEQDRGLCVDCTRTEGEQIALSLVIDDPRIEGYITHGFRFLNEDDFERSLTALQRIDDPLEIVEVARELERVWREQHESGGDEDSGPNT